MAKETSWQRSWSMDGRVGGKLLKARIQGFGCEATQRKSVLEEVLLSQWRDSGRLTSESIARVFEKTVNAMADSIDDTIGAVIRNDNPCDRPYKHSSHLCSAFDIGRYRQSRRTGLGLHARRSTPPEDAEAEWADAGWSDMISSVHVGDNLDSFMSLVKCQCDSAASGREIGALVAQELMKARDTEATMRALCILRAVVECNLPNTQLEIAAICGAMLENLKPEPCFREVVTDILRRLPLATEPGNDRLEMNSEVLQLQPPDRIDTDAKQLNSENMANAEVPEKVDLLCGNIPIMEVDGQKPMDFLGVRELHETPEQSRSDILSLASLGSPLVTSRASNESEMFLQVEKFDSTSPGAVTGSTTGSLSSDIFSSTPCTSPLTMANASKTPYHEDEADFDPFTVVSGASSFPP